MPGIYNDWQPVEKQFGTRQLEQSAVATVGLTTARAAGRNASLALRASRSNGFSNSGGTDASLTRYAALLSIDLTK